MDDPGGWERYERDEDGRTWVVPGETCPACIATFPHRHLLRPDGTLSNVMERTEENVNG